MSPTDTEKLKMLAEFLRTELAEAEKTPAQRVEEATQFLDTITEIAAGKAITDLAGERVLAVYNALVCKHLHGDVEALDLLTSEDRYRFIGQAAELVAQSLLGEAANLYSSIEHVSNATHVPGPFPLARAGALAAAKHDGSRNDSFGAGLGL